MEVTQLEYGDIFFEGNGPKGLMQIGIERKRIGDLMQSIISGRLVAHQLPGMAKMYDVRYLLTEGTFRPDREGLIEQCVNLTKNGGKPYYKWFSLKTGPTKYTYRQYVGFVNTLLLQEGVPEIRTSDEWESAHRILCLYNHWQKEWEQHRSMKAFHSVDSTQVFLRQPKLVERVAKELPGIGWDRSKAAGKKFRTVRALVEATELDWQAVEGVGKKTAEKVVKAINSKE